ncbi:MAG: hypothetical protein ACTSRG_24770 [Candidatus Helarchaeota archaeon]
MPKSKRKSKKINSISKSDTSTSNKYNINIPIIALDKFFKSLDQKYMSILQKVIKNKASTKEFYETVLQDINKLKQYHEIYEFKLFCPDCSEEVKYNDYHKETSNLYYAYLNCSNCDKNWVVPFVISQKELRHTNIPEDLESLWKINRLDLLESEGFDLKFPLRKNQLKTFKNKEKKYKKLLKNKEIVQEEYDDLIAEYFQDLI